MLIRASENNLIRKTTMKIILPEGPITADNYFTFPAINQSSLKIYAKSPNTFWKSSPLNPERSIFESKDTPDKVLGKVCHALIYEPETFDKFFAVEPEGIDRRTNKGKAAWEDFLYSAEGKTAVKLAVYEQAKLMAEAIHNHPSANKLFKMGAYEIPLLFKIEGCDLWLKAKPDQYIFGKIFDYKTTINLAEFDKEIEKWKYHYQSYFYKKAIEYNYKETPEGHIILGQDKENFDDIRIMSLSPQASEEAGEEILRILKSIEARIKDNYWFTFNPFKVENIERPQWAKTIPLDYLYESK